METAIRRIATRTGVRIIKRADDPLGVTRISVGGGGSTGVYYVVYRGTKESAIEALRAAIAAVRAMARHLGPEGEPDVEPDPHELSPGTARP